MTTTRPPGDGADWLTTAEAARRLGVKPETLYAYVSRGLLTSRRRPSGRGSLFRLRDIEELEQRSRRSGRSGELDAPVETSLTLLDDRQIYYRGLDASQAAGSMTFEQVAEWLWSGRHSQTTGWIADAATIRTGRRAQAALPAHALPLDRIRVIAAAVAVADEMRFETSTENVAVAARRLLCGLVDALPLLSNESDERFVLTSDDPSGRRNRTAPARSLAARLWARLSDTPPTRRQLAVLNAAMVMQADHELSPSTLVARIAASVQANPYAVVGAALGALHGALHGGVSLATESLLSSIEDPRRSAEVIGERMRRGDRIAGFGQPFHPSGDPRAAVLLDLLRAASPDRRRMAVVDAVIDTTRSRGFPPPNADFALGALSFVSGMRPGAGEAIFAISRTAGWIAHALEEYERESMIRPRAVYTGPSPS